MPLACVARGAVCLRSVPSMQLRVPRRDARDVGELEPGRQELARHFQGAVWQPSRHARAVRCVIAAAACALQGLNLLESLLKMGHERVVDDARDHLFRIRTLTDFMYHEGAMDRGSGGTSRAALLGCCVFSPPHLY